MATRTMEPVSTKLRPDEKRAFLETCDSIGTSPSNALRMFVSAFNRRGGFPFDPSNSYGFNAETLAAMDDAAAGRVSGPYDTVSDMIAALDENYPMLKLEFTAKFKKDYKRAKKQGRNMRVLENVLETLQPEEELPAQLHDHELVSNYKGHRECHLAPGWLLICRVEGDRLTLTAT